MQNPLFYKSKWLIVIKYRQIIERRQFECEIYCELVLKFGISEACVEILGLDWKESIRESINN
ncbi:unnamed protein product [Paramecium primaurelia]|uniref:Uncharacterized protein n=1 Tax=Paramecium primaurelia TaxID=5886 RepID=A0A8S1P2B3_PARPR|nr:unnamed protein product [Paramecium primaurelia]